MTPAKHLSDQAGLSGITSIILETGSSKGELWQAVADYAVWLESINPVEKFRFNPVKPVILPSGKAIDPMNAAHCIADFARTVQFIRGLYDAVLAARSRFRTSPIHVFYAGTGPYAALALPLTTIFSPEEVQFTLVEAHPVTYDLLLHTIDSLGLQPWIKTTVCQDACTLHLTDFETVQVFLTETMHGALKSEPQVAITRHFAPQLPSDAIFLPEKIKVWAALSNPLNNHNRTFSSNADQIFDYELGTLLELTRNLSAVNVDEAFPIVSFAVPENLRFNYPLLSLYTEITIFGAHKLNTGESPLTLPVQVFDFRKENLEGEVVGFQYQIGENPGFKIIPPDTTPLHT